MSTQPTSFGTPTIRPRDYETSRRLSGKENYPVPTMSKSQLFDMMVQHGQIRRIVEDARILVQKQEKQLKGLYDEETTQTPEQCPFHAAPRSVRTNHYSHQQSPLVNAQNVMQQNQELLEEKRRLQEQVQCLTQELRNMKGISTGISEMQRLRSELGRMQGDLSRATHELHGLHSHPHSPEYRPEF
eukprot:c32669_g1_i1.p1 GENE.c32669_g1_i1~~c32669_g1_i1.p1  ORF type:complete len:199 (+),score=41.51 c32669_g1_i1:40-597(+)